MRKWLFLLILLSAAAVAAAQQPSATTYGERLEAVHSAASAYAFLFSLQPVGYIDTSRDSLMLNAAEQCFIYQIRTDSVSATELDSCARYAIPQPFLWAKADFDGDGQPDLFFDSGYGHAYGVLNRGASLPLVLPLIMHGYWRDCHSFTIFQQNGHWLISHLQISRRRHNRHGRRLEPQVWQDTLIYHLGAFVEYNAHVNHRIPRIIGFRYHSGGPPPRAGFDLRINTKTGWVKRQMVSYRKAHPIYELRYRLRSGMLDTLRQQLAYLNIAGLRGDYEKQALDASTVLLTFHHRFRPAKVVEDYGQQGTYGLRRLYNLIFHAYEQAEKRQEVR